MNVPLFLSAFHLHEHRMNLQPSLVYAALALSTFLKSSNLEEGQTGREKACAFSSSFYHWIGLVVHWHNR